MSYQKEQILHLWIIKQRSIYNMLHSVYFNPWTLTKNLFDSIKSKCKRHRSDWNCRYSTWKYDWFCESHVNIQKQNYHRVYRFDVIKWSCQSGFGIWHEEIPWKTHAAKCSELSAKHRSVNLSSTGWGMRKANSEEKLCIHHSSLVDTLRY